jgi:hypothetical protein
MKDGYQPSLTPDQGGGAKTREMAQAVLAAYRG